MCGIERGMVVRSSWSCLSWQYVCKSVLYCVVILEEALGTSCVHAACLQDNGATALHLASFEGHEAVVRMLLASGAAASQARTVSSWLMVHVHRRFDR